MTTGGNKRGRLCFASVLWGSPVGETMRASSFDPYSLRTPQLAIRQKFVFEI